jgi:NADPH:quinone reductase-like Zn-dependent oxidoreductase
MQAIVTDGYGPPERLELRELPRPAVADDGVLVRVRAASVNPADWHILRGLPYFARLTEGLRTPKRRVPGVDAAGTVEAVGPSVTELRPGDEVFGACSGSLAEYACGRERALAPKPSTLTFEQAAAVPLAGVTALQALRDRGRLVAGQRVAINGAAGGVGTFAVQIAKAFGAEVTGVCSTRNVDLVRSLGADRVVDYTSEDFTATGERYDLVLDLVGNRSLPDLRRATAPRGTLIPSGGGDLDGNRGKVLGPARLMLRAAATSPFVGQRMPPFLAKVGRDDLLVLRELVDAGKVRPVIDRNYPLPEAPEALRYLEAGHARGKVVIIV